MKLRALSQASVSKYNDTRSHNPPSQEKRIKAKIKRGLDPRKHVQTDKRNFLTRAEPSDTDATCEKVKEEQHQEVGDNRGQWVWAVSHALHT